MIYLLGKVKAVSDLSLYPLYQDSVWQEAGIKLVTAEWINNSVSEYQNMSKNLLKYTWEMAECRHPTCYHLSFII